MTRSSSPQFLIRTLGCKANVYDSQLLEAEFRKRGWEAFSSSTPSESLVCVVNSCTVTDEADRQSRKLAARMARDYPQSRVVITGCSAEVDPERLVNSKGIHYVIGNRDKPRMVDLIQAKLNSPRPEAGEVLGVARGYEEIASRHEHDRDWIEPSQAFVTPPVGVTTRAFLKIQEGCNSFCTYCIIPYGRGPSRSLRPREILSQIRELVSNGVREVVLTGTNIGDYGTDWDEKPQLDELLKMILGETQLERLRVSSLDPTEITATTRALMESDSRFCPHFHVSLQSSSDRVLKLMKRKYGVAQVRECLQAISEIETSQPGGVFVGMDVITGFPGETPEEFESSYQELSRLPWSRLHIFPFSEREGTPATRLPLEVAPSERIRRARLLQELSLNRISALYRKLSQHRSRLENILLEKTTKDPFGKKSNDWMSGYTSNYLRVFLKCNEVRNSLVSAEVREFVIDAPSGDAFFIA